MRLPFLALTVLGCGAAAQIPLSTYTGPFTSNATRGYFFQAPADFVVTHLQVPDEGKIGAQAVALYRMTSAPPQYSQSVSVTPVFFAAVANADYIPVTPPVLFKKDEWVGVLGGCGTATTTLRNSYGAGNYASRVRGMPVTLLRFLMQANIATNSGVGSVSAEGTASIARVRMFVAGQGQAMTYGKGSGATPGELQVHDPLPPSINYSGQFQVLPGFATNQGAILLWSSSRFSAPTPYGELLVGLPFLLVSALPSLSAAGTPVTLPLPNDNNLLGVVLTFQAGIVVLPTLWLTNGLEWRIGL